VQVIEKLFEFVIILADEIKAADEGNVDIDISSTKALLSWTLMLISSSFDVIVSS
jgi:hypothetical protein